ncbi:MAG: ABC transporter ATP-binding protein, partial [Desulfuromonadales bacterium]|nr:ABC transporter ATP-binding protein [Desulfuromonadales bacterium]
IYKLYDSPQDRLKEALNPFRKKYHRDFYALDDISFEIKKGETVGIIGRNGAGKSTLLKIITGVIASSGGNVKVNGRISALLELGAGFNPLISGLENVYFNGTLMGFNKEEMDNKIDEILAFADIGDFIHQPVKTYSSGMKARLAFAAAISIQPEILIVDEALAVGDVAFQYKCYQKMWSMKENGATMLLVTHSTQHILEQCDKAVLMSNGRLLYQGSDVEEVVTRYEKLLRNVSESEMNPADQEQDSLEDIDFSVEPDRDIAESRFGTGRAIIKSVVITGSFESNEDIVIFRSGRRIFIKFLIFSRDEIDNIALGVSLRRKDSADIWGDNNIYANQPITLKKGVNRIVYETTLNVVSGEYLLFCGLATYRGNEREELDQRWPIRIIKVASDREGIGYIYSPIKVLTGF